ncbi:hypothetical protein ACIOG8_07075 [Streptomyces erythrochromogenes]
MAQASTGGPDGDGGAGIVVMTACSRLVCAMSRDARFPRTG